VTAEYSQRVRDLLQDIVEWGERCERHLAGLSQEQFLKDEMVREALSKCVEVVGTAARKLMEASPGIDHEHPELELRRAYATRIRLAHVYGQIDDKVLWETATQSIPAIVTGARKILANGS
jgi:uncharacterized protein with HEPN domain